MKGPSKPQPPSKAPPDELGTSRVEAFSDGVIAIIITIMVLELKPPHEQSFEALAALWPTFLSYIISFVFVAIYWVNHHNLISHVRRISPAILWANNLLLFWLSLIPFATAYMGETNVSPFTTMIYGVVQLGCAAGFMILSKTIAARHRDDPRHRAHAHAMGRKNLVSLILYMLAVPAAYVHPAISIMIFIGIGAIYTVPRFLARPEPPVNAR